MNVFIYDNGNNRLEINEPEILLIKEFKALSDRDKTKNKERLGEMWKGFFYPIMYLLPIIGILVENGGDCTVSICIFVLSSIVIGIFAGFFLYNYCENIFLLLFSGICNIM